MDYTPRFSQPFTLAEAINLDVAVITEEIARLQNSLARLHETQNILQIELEGPGEVDPEIKKAFEENKTVIGSQDERISMLKMALTDKGINSGSHYDTAASSVDKGTINTRQPAAQDSATSNTEGEEDGGVFL